MHRKRTDFLYDLTHDRCGKAVLPALSKLGERPLEQWQYKGFVRLMASPKLVVLLVILRPYRKTCPGTEKRSRLGKPMLVTYVRGYECKRRIFPTVEDLP